MRRVIPVCLALLLLATPLLADSALFVTSVPLGAEVTVNGTAYGATPILIRGLAAGEYEITAVKPGHFPETARIAIGADAVSAVRLLPEPDIFVGAFSSEETVVGGERFARRDATFEMPSGTYELSGDARTLELNPVYPREGARRAAQMVTFAGGFAALLATLEDVLVSDGRAYFTSYLPSPATITVWTMTAAAGGFWIALEAEKRDYEERMVVRRFTGDLTAAQAELFFTEGEAALEAGNLSRALTSYTRVVAEGGDSEFAPEALYKSAQIYSVSGDTDLAARLLELLITDFPSPEVYDRALALLAQVLVEQGRYDEAIGRLEQMVFYDPLYERADIDERIAEIRALESGDDE